ncbi:GNAT family N-acetyltransferase [Fulvivirgaceae bacterium BMA12]|uniref:GNAT family N-acetyltransferase n=1 Tax=Agaribacillus aureus TaxID=3051825 RepID=A0ABT8L9D0_9BACT|nr:GNAT family N-acetyltransferase [Fulvivirgaceae bacterium BMA12]
MSSLKFYKDYKNDQKLRDQFFEFTPKALYGADFKQWYLKGAWSNYYKPYSFGDGRQLVANVSFSTMELYLEGNPVKGIQLATVGTLPEYRNRGLSRQLMETVLEVCDAEAELVFLFANESVLDFYPKFGFKAVRECLFQTDILGIESSPCARQLDLNDKKDFELLRRMTGNRLPLTKVFGAHNYDHILLWHLIYYFGECIWYLEENDLIFIAEADGNTWHLFDILSTDSFSFKTVLPNILPQGTDRMVCHFTPDLLDMDFQILACEMESPLFVRGDFPLKELTFKFPALAQT